MDKDFSKFLSSKLYLIETLSGKRLDDDTMKKIHDICLGSYSEISKLYDDLFWLQNFN